MTVHRERGPSNAPGPSIVRCLGCDYDLRAQPGDGRCPECGLAVRRSTAGPSDFNLGPAGWLGGLATGAALLLAAQLLWAGSLLFAQWLNLGYRTIMAIDDLVALLLAAGGWLLTRPRRPFGPSGLVLRWLLRLISALPVAACTLLHAGFYTGNMYMAATWHVTQPLALLPFLLFFHLGRLARRAGSARLGEYWTRAGVGLTASVVLTAGLDWAERSHCFVSGTPPQASLVAGCLIVAFYLWAMVSLAWFVVVFRRVWRVSRDGP